jgi:hypothetical protein
LNGPSVASLSTRTPSGPTSDELFIWLGISTFNSDSGR